MIKIEGKERDTRKKDEQNNSVEKPKKKFNINISEIDDIVFKETVKSLKLDAKSPNPAPANKPTNQ